MNITQPFNDTNTISVYVWNQEIVILLLAIIAFCLVLLTLNMLSKEVLKDWYSKRE